MNNHTTLLRRRHRVRHIITGTATRPRLSVHLSNRQVLAQLIDDTQDRTLAYISSLDKSAPKSATMTEKAVWIGAKIATLAGEHKISTIVFDRGERRYHGRTKALAEAARANGLKF